MRILIVGLVIALSGVGFLGSEVQAKPAKARCAEFLSRIAGGESDAKDDLERELAVGMARWFKRFQRIPSLTEFAAFLDVSPAQMRKSMKVPEDVENTEDLFELSIKLVPFEYQSTRERIARVYAKTSKELMRSATEQQVADEIGIPLAALEKFLGKDRLFKNFEEVKSLARDLNPEAFDKVIGDQFLSDESRDALISAVAKHKRIIYTSVVSKAPVNRAMFAALINYAERRDAIIVVRPINYETNNLDSILFENERVFISLDGIHLSPFKSLSETQVLSKMIMPNTGQKRIGKRGQSRIIGATKAHVDTAATKDNVEVSHEQISSGALTDPFYSGLLPVQRRTDSIATNDHFLGAVIVERGESADQIHSRHIEFIPEERGFVDLDTFYRADGKVEKLRAEAMVFGDIHVGDTDPEILKTLPEQIKKFRPKRIMLHDLFNGYSINRHEADQMVTLAAKAEAGQLSLKGEIQEVQKFLKWLVSIVPEDCEIVVVKSNHDLFLNKWLQSDRWSKDPYNVKFGAELFQEMVNENDPLEYAIRKDADFDTKNIRFLKVEDSYKVGPENRMVELGIHGHAGPNGRPASIGTLQEAADRVVVGHMHSNTRRNGIVVVGTFTKKRVGYNKDGSSSWVQSMAVVGANGEIQVLNFDEGSWYLARDKDASKNFEKNYPKLEVYQPPEEGSSKGDQYAYRTGR